MAAVFTAKGTLRGEEGTCLLGKMIASSVERNDLICLKGELGSGKTSFARAFISTLNKDARDITSPTFALLHTYESTKGMIWHFDLYRLKSQSELLELGLKEALREGVTLIEWPEIAETYLPDSRIEITFSYTEDNNARNFELVAYGDRIEAIRALNLSQYFSLA